MGSKASQPSPYHRGPTSVRMPVRTNASYSYAISNIGTDVPSQVNRKISMGRGPRGGVALFDRYRAGSAEGGDPTAPDQGEGSVRSSTVPPTPFWRITPAPLAPLTGSRPRSEHTAADIRPDKKALTAHRKPPAGKGRWSAEGTRQHPSSSPASSIPDRTPQRGCCCSAGPEEIGTIEQPARGILALSDIVPHARAIPSRTSKLLPRLRRFRQRPNSMGGSVSRLRPQLESRIT